MTNWTNGKLKKITLWCNDNMTYWQNNKFNKRQFKNVTGEMKKGQNDEFTKWQVYKMTSWQNDVLAKWWVDKMMSWQNDQAPNCCPSKCQFEMTFFYCQTNKRHDMEGTGEYGSRNYSIKLFESAIYGCKLQVKINL
jgi:hypothetical protein